MTNFLQQGQTYSHKLYLLTVPLPLRLRANSIQTSMVGLSLDTVFNNSAEAFPQVEVSDDIMFRTSVWDRKVKLFALQSTITVPFIRRRSCCLCSVAVSDSCGQTSLSRGACLLQVFPAAAAAAVAAAAATPLGTWSETNSQALKWPNQKSAY